MLYEILLAFPILYIYRCVKFTFIFIPVYVYISSTAGHVTAVPLALIFYVSFQPPLLPCLHGSPPAAPGTFVLPPTDKHVYTIS